MFLWPRHNRVALENLSNRLFSRQHVSINISKEDEMKYIKKPLLKQKAV